MEYENNKPADMFNMRVGALHFTGLLGVGM